MLDAALGNNAPQIPNKLYFRIGEVARLTGLKQHVLRYWETEFPKLNPKKSGTNHRLYRRKDVELLLQIKTLLYDKRYTIEGARNYLEQQLKSHPPPPPPGPQDQGLLFGPPPQEPHMGDIRRQLEEILAILK